MTDARSDLERARRQAPAPRFGLDDVYRRLERRRARSRLTATVLGLAVTMLIVAAAVTALTRTTNPTLPIANGVDLSLAPGEYAYTKVAHYMLDDEESGVYARFEMELWWATDGSGRMVFHGDPGETVDYEPGLGHGADRDVTFGPDGHRWQPLDLSTDPAVALDQLRRRSAPDGASPQPEVTLAPRQPQDDANVVRAAQQILSQGEFYPTPEQRATLFAVMRSLEGGELRRDAADPLGRLATMISFGWYGGTYELYVDPETAQPLAQVFREGDTVLAAWLVLRSGVATSTDDRALARAFVPDARAEPGFLGG